MQTFKYGITPLGEGAFALDEDGVRCFLFEGENTAMLVDTGFGKGDLKETCETLTNKPIFVVNTHADGDHLGCGAQFKKTFMHPAEFDYYKNKAAGPLLETLPIWEGDILDLGTRRFEVIHIPGHTPGSIALLDRANKLLLTGDSAGCAPIYMFGPGRNMPAFEASTKKLIALYESGAFETILPCHGPINVDCSILYELLEGAKELMAGNLTGEPPMRDLPCLLYKYKRIAFLYP